MFYEQIRKLCAENDIAITTLARKLHLSPNAPNNWKNGSLPKAETIIKLADYFDVSTDFLLCGSEKQTAKTAYASNGASIVNENANSSISVSTNSGESSGDVQGFEIELIRIYRSLDMKGKSALIQYAFSLEDGQPVAVSDER